MAVARKPSIRDRDLLFLLKAHKEKIAAFRAGVSLEFRTGRTIDEIVHRGVKDRLVLARRCLDAAHDCAAAEQFRSSVSRAYYSMYHTIRSVVFFITDGDDHEQHTVLPGHLPTDFPSNPQWENDLKIARLERNRADYDPYPRDRSFEPTAITTMSQASTLLPVARQYLVGKGCKL